MKPRARKIIHTMMIIMLVLAPLQFSGAALHMDCAITGGVAMMMMDGDDGAVSAGAGDVMSTADPGQDTCLGMTHGCVACGACFAASVFPLAAAYSGEVLRPVREQRPDSTCPTPSFRPPIALQS